MIPAVLLFSIEGSIHVYAHWQGQGCLPSRGPVPPTGHYDEIATVSPFSREGWRARARDRDFRPTRPPGQAMPAKNSDERFQNAHDLKIALIGPWKNRLR